VGGGVFWDPTTRERYDRIIRRSIETSTDPTQLPLANVKLRDLTVDRIVEWSRANEQRFAPTTASFSLGVLNQVCRYALRRGWLADNPVARLESEERPRWTPRPVGILEGGRSRPHAGAFG
jgi:site-specific recombinase XerD